MCPSPEPRSPRRASLVDGADGVDVSGRSRRAAFRRGRRRGAFVSDAPTSALRDAREDPWSALRCEARETAARGPVVRRDARCAGLARVARRLVKPRAFRFWSTQNEAHHVRGSSPKSTAKWCRVPARRRNSAPTTIHSWAFAKKRRQSLPRHGGALERATREGRRGGVQAGEESRMGRPRRRRVPREPRRALR